MAGLFGDLDVASAEDNPWAVPANTYKMNVFKVEKKNDKNDNPGLLITYRISEGDHEGKSVTEWKVIPTPADPNNLTADEKKAQSYLKMRLASLGIPESRMNTVGPEDLEGLEVIVKVTVNGDFTNVNRVELADSAAAPAQSFTGFGG